MCAAKPVLLTGASGLLGRAIYRCFSEDPEWDITGLAFTRATGDLRKVDLTNESEVEKIITEVKPALVIHSAVERRSDVVENQDDSTHQLNVAATLSICKHAANIGAPVVFISTDYVFDGKNPPYAEIDQTDPLNKYGHSKIAGEKAVLQTSQKNIILRVQHIYGPVERLNECAITYIFEQVKENNKSSVMSHYERRFPTHVSDIACVLKQLAQRCLQDPGINGIFHCGGTENMTKYDIAIAMAEVFNLSTNHIEADSSPSCGGNRPYNAQLSSAKLEAVVGRFKRTPFKDGITKCLRPFEG